MFDITSHTKQLGIIGDPIEHSFSPQMHNFISQRMHNDYIYSAWHVKKEELGAAIAGIRALGIRGVNVTAPHKVEVMQYLDVISDRARLLGSVNTVVNRNGELWGYNTDADGLYMSILRAGMEIRGKKLLVIGAGGVVKPVLMRFIQEEPLSVTVVNRTQARAEELGQAIYEQMGYRIQTEIEDEHFDFVMNTTSAGMEPQTDVLPTDQIERIKDLSFIDENTSVVDMIYNPDRTRFLKCARERGARVLNGLGMLIYQGIIAYELFTETKLPEDMGEAIKKEVFGR
ncbi:MAG: shikimate dehydrogenase [Clostridiales bacterium]|nr:shikimate dehydrogenase [Clostridiales bacterium]